MPLRQAISNALVSIKNLLVYLLVSVFRVLAWPFKTIKDFFNFIVDYLLSTAKTTLQKLLLLWITLTALVVLAITFHAVFYSVYVPTAVISRPVYLTFSVCSSGAGICSFPSANVTFWNQEYTHKEVLGSGQAYSLTLDLEMPDSVANRNLGMFMVNVKLYDRNFTVNAASQRSVMYKYRSIVTRMFELMMMLPLHFFGFSEQTQKISVVMFPHLIDNYYHPSVGAVVEVQNHQIEIYSATLTLAANFTGLKYLLYNWPITSALFALWFNLFILALGLALILFQRSAVLKKVAVTLDLANEGRDEEGEEEEDSEETSVLQAVEENESLDQSTQTKTEDEDNSESEPDDMPPVQEPVDFVEIGADVDADLLSELRQRRIN